jgi:hypothetical protein
LFLQAGDKSPYLGVYYHCRDLYFAFYYYRERVTPRDRGVIIHYASLALLKELLDTLIVAEGDPDGKLGDEALARFQELFKRWFTDYSPPPEGTSVLRHVLSRVDNEKHQLGLWLRRGHQGNPPAHNALPADFLPMFCKGLQEIIPWLAQIPVFFFLDDFSSPHVPPPVQAIMNDLLMQRWDSCCFKLSTESIVTFTPHDSAGKLMDGSRDYEALDLGSYFLQDPERRRTFLIEVINNRLSNAAKLDPTYHDIANILGGSPHESYVELAKQLRRESEESGVRVYYAGISTLTDIFSGDIADMLRLVGGMFLQVGSGSFKDFETPGIALPFPEKTQDSVIREYGGNFLSRVEDAPNSGRRLRDIATAFGEVAHQHLLRYNSGNQGSNPPKQAFRIELFEEFSLLEERYLREAYEILIPPGKRHDITISQFGKELKAIYDDLLRYGVFLRDARGKSPRGDVVPRLYLRRLLIPTFKLTPSQRDNIRLEVTTFLILLYDPHKFVTMVSGTDDSQRRL